MFAWGTRQLKILTASAVLPLLLVVAGWGAVAQAAPAKTSILKINLVTPSDSPVTLAVKAMAEEIKRQSNGTFDVQVYANSELGSNKDNVEMAAKGASIATHADVGYIADYVPDFLAMTLPYLYRDYRDVHKVTASAWFVEMQKIAAQKGLKIFPQNWVYGTRHFLSGRMIRTPADVKGMKVRVPPNKVQLEMVIAMGGNPVTIAWGEVYTSLSQGVIDAIEAPLADIYSIKLYEARKKVALTGHLKGMNGLIMSQQVFDDLPADHQKLLEGGTIKYGVSLSESIANDEGTLWRQRLEEKGVVLNDTDVAAFAKATEVVASKFSWTPGTVDKIKAALK